MDAHYRWMGHYQHYCVSLVQGVTSGETLFRMGGSGSQPVRGGPRDVMALFTEEQGYWPVVRVVSHAGWVVAVEQQSMQGARPEVLRRLANGTRAVSLAQSGDGMWWLGYAEDGAVVDLLEPPVGRDDAEWPRLAELARRAGVPVNAVDGEPGPRKMMLFASEVCGFALTDDIIAAEGDIAAVLPLLPDVTTERRMVHFEADTELAGLLRSVPDERLAPAAAACVHEVLAGVGIDDTELVDAVTTVAANNPRPVEDDSAVGMRLRMLAAAPLQADGAAVDPRGQRLLPPEEVAALHRRRDAAVITHTLLTGGPQPALEEMLHRWPGQQWRDQLRSEFADVTLTEQARSEVERNREALRARRARSIPVDPSLIRPANEAATGMRERAVRHGDARPAPDNLGAQDEQ